MRSNKNCVCTSGWSPEASRSQHKKLCFSAKLKFDTSTTCCGSPTWPATALAAIRLAVHLHCRSRKSIRTHIPMFNFLLVYNPFFLQVVSQLYFTSMSPNKIWETEQLFFCLLVYVLQPGDVHELRGGSKAAPMCAYTCTCTRKASMMSYT